MNVQFGVRLLAEKPHLILCRSTDWMSEALIAGANPDIAQLFTAHNLGQGIFSAGFSPSLRLFRFAGWLFPATLQELPQDSDRTRQICFGHQDMVPLKRRYRDGVDF